MIFGGPQGSSVARSCHPNLWGPQPLGDQQIRPPGPGRLKVSQRTSEMGEVALCSRAPRARGATASGRVTAPSPGPRAALGGRLAAAGASIATAWELRRRGAGEEGQEQRRGIRGEERRGEGRMDFSQRHSPISWLLIQLPRGELLSPRFSLLKMGLASGYGEAYMVDIKDYQQNKKQHRCFLATSPHLLHAIPAVPKAA